MTGDWRLPHRRFDPLRGEWVLVSPHRNERPWQGQIERAAAEHVPPYDPDCYLCPGNRRANGVHNPHYTSTFAFDNDFAALVPDPLATDDPLSLIAPSHTSCGGPPATGDQPRSTSNQLATGNQSPATSNQSATGNPSSATSNQPATSYPPQLARITGELRRDLAEAPSTKAGEQPTTTLLQSEQERGVCRVVCFTPRHDLTLPLMDRTAIRTVIDAWIGECASLAAVPWLSYALVFENRGALMGASNPHPHGQIWATERTPNEPARELASLGAYRQRHGSCLLCDYVALEIAWRERVVCSNDHFVAVVPYWAVWPFETLVISRRHVAALRDLDDASRNALAEILKQLTTRYDNLFETSFPYSMGFHQALRDDAEGLSHLHAHFYPPLLRSATVRKFLVGFELLGEPQRDLTPEDAAARLQEIGDVHYSARSGAGIAR